MLDRREVLPAQKETQSPVWSGNRAQRRKNKDWRPFAQSALVGQYNRFEHSIAETVGRWNQVVGGHDNNLTKALYQGEPFIGRWLEVRRKLPFFLEQAQLKNLDPANRFVSTATLNRFDEQDYYSRELGVPSFLGVPLSTGTSLFDIEQMPLLKSTSDGRERFQLQAVDIQRINGMFHEGQSRRPGRDTSVVLLSMIYLASQEFARPDEKTPLPQSLHPLRDRLVAYFDYYQDLMTSFGFSLKDEYSFLGALQYTKPWLPHALGMFMPARLGITPASAVKLFQTRSELSSSPLFWRTSGILKTLELSAADAHREKNLPTNLQRYQDYDRDTDNEALRQLWQFYGGADLSEQELARVYTDSTNLLDKLIDLYFKDVYSDIMRSPQRQLKLAMPQDHLIKEVTLTCQNKQVLIFILHFADGKTHLTLELSQGDKFYGMPAKAVKDNPHFISFIFADILPPVLEAAKKRHPDREPIRLSDYRRTEPLMVQTVVFDQLPTPSVELPVPKRVRSRPRRLLTPLAQYLSGPKPVDHQDSPEFKYSVIHSKALVEEKMGRGARPNDVERVMEHIRRFELGFTPIKMIDWSEGKRVVGRVGDLRIVYNHLGNGVYALEAIGDREYIYKHYGDYKVD
ncbi:MAG: hypothetical protein HYW45_02935 [Candidatus Daviesbacteria bacterium]|nr:MAG: hypothetical protein HYW45_02935 [Candidatus Daviesbacteria bacterium]